MLPSRTTHHIFESQLRIIIPNIQGLCFASQTTPLRFPIFMQFLQFHNECNIVTWVKEHFGKRNTPFEIGHVRDMKKTSVTVFLLYFPDFFKFGHKVFTECGKPSYKPFVKFLIGGLENFFRRCRICLSLPRISIYYFPQLYVSFLMR